MKPEQSHFESARKDFENLKKNKQIPPQMEIKLQYLLARVENKPIKNFPIDSLPEYQKNSLDQLNLETGTHLFCNIVNCLSGKDVVLYFRDEKAYIRKDQIFAMWRECWITCDSNNIIVRKKIGQKPTEVFDIVNLRISKNFKLYKKKYVFGACYNKKKNYLIGFDLQAPCSRTHQLIRGLIREKVNRINRNKQEVSEITISRVLEPESKKQIPMNSQQQAKQEQSYEQALDEPKDQQLDENSDRGMVIEFIKQHEINGDTRYRLNKTEDNLRQLIDKNYVNKFKTEIILPRPKISTNIFDNYIRMSEWNPEIEECAIKIKVSQNSYLLQVRVKKYSYMSWPRETMLLATGLMYRGNYFLVLRSTGEDCTFNDTVKMEWNQIVEICESQDKVLLSIGTEMDFKGYCSLDDSQRMGLKVIDSLKLFTKFHQAKQISSKSTKLFNIIPPQKVLPPKQKLATSNVSNGKKMQESIVRQVKLRKMSTNSQFEVPDDESKQQASETLDDKQLQSSCKLDQDAQNFAIYMQKNFESELSPKLIELIKKKANQRYYLRQKFDQEVHLDTKFLEHVAEGPNHYILQNGNWKINEEEDIVFMNEKQMQLQKDIIKMVIKQLGSNIMSGKSIMNMSLPVEIFDNRSILERVAMGFGYAAKFLVAAAETEDLIEQAKLLSLFVFGIGPLHLSLLKPFNPILGQTFQCRVGGVPLYLEQISHHPPISAVLIKTESFMVHGAFHSHAEMGLNRVTGKNLSPLFVDFFKTNTFYEIKTADMEISGLIHGEKKYRGIGRGYIHEKTNNRFIQWSIGKDKKKVYQADGKIKPNDLFGGIYTVSPGFSKKFKECENKQKFDGLKPDDIIETHEKITGHWCLNIFFNGVLGKSVTNPLPNKISYVQPVLPSDSNFRIDLLYKRMEDFKTANEEKQIMENIQRRDRKLRQGKIKPGQKK